MMSASVAAETLTRIENDRYTVEVDAAAGTFTITAKATEKCFARDGKLAAAGGKASVEEATDKSFGAGQKIAIEYTDGRRETISLYRGLPFVLFGGSLRNATAAPVVHNRVAGPSVVVDLGKPLAALRTLGTGGLLEPAKNPGSYAFLTIVDPETRRGVVGGWLSHERGSGVVFSPVEGDVVRLDARLEYGRLRIPPGGDTAAETFALGYFDDARLGLEAYADAIAKLYAVKLPPPRAGHCTWYMDKHAGACDEQHLAELAAYAAEHLRPFGFDFVQIDDHWQAGENTKNGPRKNFTTHAANGPYPAGMKAAADNIKRLELTPGIWFMPFAGSYKDSFFRDHQDWFVKNSDGQPYDTAWGGTCLDMTHPGAREHLRGIVRRMGGEWGYRVFKMDGMWTGTATKQIYVNDGYKEDGIGDATFANPDKTNIEVFRDGIKLVREAAGPDVFLLGCCVSQNMRSFGGSFGLLDAMRVGPDTGAGRIGAPHASRLWFLNGRVWWNDPDCVSVRVATPLDQARLNASFTAIAGALFYNSDWIPDLPPERLDILRRCMPNHGLPARPVDVFEQQPARIWHLADTRGPVRRDVVALYNWGREPATITCPVGRIGLPPAEQYVGFDFWANKFVPPFRDTITADLPPGGSCRILALRPTADHPQLVSTSRHVTQGIVDVIDEKWDATAKTLSGMSRVIANDPYELRVVVPTGATSWRLATTSVAAADKTAGVKISHDQDGPRIRVKFTSPVSREVRWQLGFQPAECILGPPVPVTDLKATVDFRRVSLTWKASGADSYRITRGDGTLFTTSTDALTDMTAPRGKPCRYTVEALGWDGAASPPVSVEVTPPAQPKRPAAPPRPDVHLTDLKLEVKSIGWGKPGIDLSVKQQPLKIDGKRYAKGLGTHAKSLVVCAIPAQARRFVAIVGLDDEVTSDERASVTFEVHGDVQEMGEAPVLLAQSPVLSSETVRSWAFDVELGARYKQLRLLVTDAGDGIAADHADWVDAGFIIDGKP